MIEELPWNVGDVVRKLREKRRWTQGTLATKARVNVETVGNVEAHAPGTRRDTFEKIATALGATVAELYAMVPESRHASPTEVEKKGA